MEAYHLEEGEEEGEEHRPYHPVEEAGEEVGGRRPCRPGEGEEAEAGVVRRLTVRAWEA